MALQGDRNEGMCVYGSSLPGGFLTISYSFFSKQSLTKQLTHHKLLIRVCINNNSYHLFSVYKAQELC